MKIYKLDNIHYLNTDSMPDNVYDYWYCRYDGFKKEIEEIEESKISEMKQRGIKIIDWSDFYGK